MSLWFMSLLVDEFMSLLVDEVDEVDKVDIWLPGVRDVAF